MRLFVGHALANDAPDCLHRALGVGDSKRRALVVAEIELGKVALQMLCTDVVINAGDAALHDREITLNRVRVCITADVLTDAVIDELMTGPLPANASATVVAHGV